MNDNNIKVTLQKFREFILERDLTLQQTALWLKISHTTVARIINGKVTKPHDRTIYKIKKLIGE